MPPASRMARPSSCNGRTALPFPCTRRPPPSRSPCTRSPISARDQGALVTLVPQAIILGILTGGVYALMASGLTAIFVLGVVMQVVFVRPLKADREALSVLVTYALALGIEGLLGFFFTNNYQQLNAWYETASIPLFNFRIAYVYIFGFALCLAILGGIFWMLYRTTFGRAIRATMLNRTAAQLVGVDVDRVSALAFGVGVASAAAGGVVFGITNVFNPGSHYDLISRLLTIIVLGGLGSLRGAIVGAMVMLVSTDVTAVVISPVWASFVFFVILIVVLVVRPQGLYGVTVRDRA